MRPPGNATLRGIEAACEVALAAFEAAPDGSGDVSKADARRIRLALAWARAALATLDTPRHPRAHARRARAHPMTRRLGALRLADPSAWEGRVRDAMAQESGRVQLAAGRLGVSTRTLMRWLAEPALRDIPRHAAGVAYGPRRAPLALALAAESYRDAHAEASP